jgi:hypothetical protein
MLRFGFGRKEERDPAAVEAIKRNVRAALTLDDDVAISINEIACADPACPVLETIILIMEPGKKTRAVKVHGALAGLSADEIRAGLQA